MAIEHIEKLGSLRCPVCSTWLPKHVAGTAMVGALIVPPQAFTCSDCGAVVTFQAHLQVQHTSAPHKPPLNLRTF